MWLLSFRCRAKKPAVSWLTAIVVTTSCSTPVHCHAVAGNDDFERLTASISSANELLNNKQYEQALQQLDNCSNTAAQLQATEEPIAAEIALGYAQLHEKQGDLEKAKAEHTRALKLLSNFYPI